MKETKSLTRGRWVKSIAFAAILLALAIPAMATAQRIGFDGIPPVRVGMTLRQAESALHAKLTMNSETDSDPSICATFYVEGRDVPISYMFEHGRVTRAALGDEGAKSSIKTANGVGLGSTVAQIKRSYGRQGAWHPNTYTDEPVFEIKSTDGRSAILFYTEQGRVTRIDAGRLPSAEYIEGCD